MEWMFLLGLSMVLIMGVVFLVAIANWLVNRQENRVVGARPNPQRVARYDRNIPGRKSRR